MRSIENTVVHRPEGDTCYAAILAGILSVPADQEAGAKWDEIASVAPLIGKLQGLPHTSDGRQIYITLDEGEYEWVCRRLKATAFREISMDLYRMCTAIFTAKEKADEIEAVVHPVK